MDKLMETSSQRKVNLKIIDFAKSYCDGNLITIALQNLLSNAFKYSAKKSMTEIEFGTLIKEGRLIYFIKDNGDGFDMAYSNKLFKAFQRLHKESDFEGIGIGLATVKRIIHLHGGTIWAEGQPGEGAVFYFTLS